MVNSCSSYYYLFASSADIKRMCYKTENKDEVDDRSELSMRTLHIDDLLTKTPAFFFGLKFSFAENHKAFIQSPTLMKRLVS